MDPDKLRHFIFYRRLVYYLSVGCMRKVFTLKMCACFVLSNYNQLSFELFERTDFISRRQQSALFHISFTSLTVFHSKQRHYEYMKVSLFLSGGRVEYVGFLLAITHQSRLCCVAVSTLKTDGSCHCPLPP